MSHKTKSAVWCHSLCQQALGMALHESHVLYGSMGIGAYSAIYLLKLLNKYVVTPTWYWEMESAVLKNFTKLRNLMARMALSTPWLWI